MWLRIGQFAACTHRYPNATQTNNKICARASSAIYCTWNTFNTIQNESFVYSSDFFYINGYCEHALKWVSLCFFKTRIIEGYCLQGIVTAVLLMASQLPHLQIHFLKSVQNLSHRLKWENGIRTSSSVGFNESTSHFPQMDK